MDNVFIHRRESVSITVLFKVHGFWWIATSSKGCSLHWFSVEKFSTGPSANKWVSEWELTQSWTILYELQYFCLHWPRHMRGRRHRARCDHVRCEILSRVLNWRGRMKDSVTRRMAQYHSSLNTAGSQGQKTKYFSLKTSSTFQRRTRKPLNITSLPWILPGEHFRMNWLHY